MFKTNNYLPSKIHLLVFFSFACHCLTYADHQAIRPETGYLVLSKRNRLGSRGLCVVWQTLNMTTSSMESIQVGLPLGYDCTATEHHGGQIVGVGCLANQSAPLWVDNRLGQFLSMPFEKSRVLSAVHQGFGHVTHIAVDWLSQNVYWVDTHYEWVAMKAIVPVKVQVVSRRRRDVTEPSPLGDYRIVVDRWLEEVWTLSLSPTRGYLFWSSNTKNTEIWRSDLLGDNKKAIVWRDVASVTAMVVDDSTGTLYWTSATENRIQKCDMFGENRAVVTTGRFNNYGRLSFQGISLIPSRDLLLAVLSSDDSVYCYKTTDGRPCKLLPKFEHTGNEAMDVAYCPTREHDGRHGDLCRVRGCTQYCVVISNRAKCACKNGFRLHENGVKCIVEGVVHQRSVVVANGTHLCSFDVTSNVGLRHRYFNGVRCIVSGAENLDCIAVDSKGGRLFYSSRSSINSMNTTDGSVMKLVSNTARVIGMTYDWISDTLYWSVRGSPDTLWYMNTVRQVHNQIEHTPSSDIVDVAVDPYLKFLYVAYSNPPAVYRIAVAEGQTDIKEMFISDYINTPQRLHYNPSSSRLYVSDTEAIISFLSKAGKVKPDFDQVKTESQNYAVCKYKKYLISSTTQTLRVTLRQNGKMAHWEKNAGIFGVINDIVVFDAITQPQQQDPCGIDNGGCQQMCVRESVVSGCYCYLGYYAAHSSSVQNNVTCKSYPVRDQFLLLSDSYGGYLQLSLKSRALAGVHTTGQHKMEYLTAVYSQRRKRVYWSSAMSGDLMSSTLDGSDMQTVIRIREYESVGRIAIDQTTDNLYVTIQSNHKLHMFVYTYDGHLKRRIQSEDTKDLSIFDMALHPRRGVMYMSVTTTVIYDDRVVKLYYIARSNMDGSHFVPYFVKGSFFSFGVAIDYDDDRLYWADQFVNAIYYTSLDDTTEYDYVWRRRDSVPYSLVVHGDYVYFVALKIRGVHRVHKRERGASQVFLAPLEMATILHISLYDRRLVDKHLRNQRCLLDNGRCSTFCLPTSDGRMCHCEDGTELRDDGRTCDNVFECSERIPAGSLSPNCTRYVGTICAFRCSNGYRRNRDIYPVLLCKNDAQWNASLVGLCITDSSGIRTIKGGNSSHISSTTNSIVQPDVELKLDVKKLTIAFSVTGVLVLVAIVAAGVTALCRKFRKQMDEDRVPIVTQTQNTRIFTRRSSAESTESTEYTDIKISGEARGEEVEREPTTQVKVKRSLARPPLMILETGDYNCPMDELPQTLILPEEIRMIKLHDSRAAMSSESGSGDGAVTYRTSADALRDQHLVDRATRRPCDHPDYKRYVCIEGDENFVDYDPGLYTFADGAFHVSQSLPLQSLPKVHHNFTGSGERSLSDESSSVDNCVAREDEAHSNSLSPHEPLGRRCVVSSSSSSITRHHDTVDPSLTLDEVFDENISSVSDDTYADFTAGRTVGERLMSQDTTNNKFCKRRGCSTCRYCLAHTVRSESSGYDSDASSIKRSLSDPGGGCSYEHDDVYDQVYMPLKREPSYLSLIS